MRKKKAIALLLTAVITASAISACANPAASGEEAAVQTAESVEEAEKAPQERDTPAGEEDTSPGEGKQEAYLGIGTVGDKWYASSIAGAVSGETQVSLKDDYFTAINLDYFSDLTIKDGYSSAGVFQDADQIMTERTLELLKEGIQRAMRGSW